MPSLKSFSYCFSFSSIVSRRNRVKEKTPPHGCAAFCDLTVALVGFVAVNLLHRLCVDWWLMMSWCKMQTDCFLWDSFQRADSRAFALLFLQFTLSAEMGTGRGWVEAAHCFSQFTKLCLQHLDSGGFSDAERTIVFHESIRYFLYQKRF